MITRKEIIDSFERISHLFHYDSADRRFPDEISKLLPILEQFLRQEKDDYWPAESQKFTIPDEKVFAIPSPVFSVFSDKDYSSDTNTSNTTCNNNNHHPSVLVSSSPRKGKVEKLDEKARKNQSRKREIARRANPHLTRAKHLIARAKSIKGQEATLDQIKEKALELLENPGRVPKADYQFDANGKRIVAAMIRDHKPRQKIPI